MRARPSIVVVEPFSKPVSFHPHYRILLGIEFRRAAQRFQSDAIFLNLVCLALEVTVADITEKLAKPRSLIEDA